MRENAVIRCGSIQLLNSKKWKIHDLQICIFGQLLVVVKQKVSYWCKTTFKGLNFFHRCRFLNHSIRHIFQRHCCRSNGTCLTFMKKCKPSRCCFTSVDTFCFSISTMSMGRNQTRDNWGRVHIHIFMFTYHKNNRFKKKSVGQNTNI